MTDHRPSNQQQSNFRLVNIDYGDRNFIPFLHSLTPNSSSVIYQSQTLKKPAFRNFLS
uniref:Uncharacterized protein n=1 Tax=Kalanchoe fedtschenkoi TaxID=63787 RepID=A0A7N0ZYK0_KALFE